MEPECFIRKNTPELRLALKEIGYDICTCCTFRHWNWLHIGEWGVHGIRTVFDKEFGVNMSELFLLEKDDYCIDCGEDEEMFLKLAKEIYEKTKAG